jgi:thermitase
MAATISNPVQAAVHNSNENCYKSSELLVKFKTGNDKKTDKVLKEIGAKILEILPKIKVSRIKLPKEINLFEIKKRLQNLPFVNFAEPNYLQKTTKWAPSDPKWYAQWALKKIKVAPAWSIETGDKSVIIAIIDTGVSLDHPDLKSKIVPGFDFVDNDKTPNDTEGHGTHCAGIAAAKTNNKTGVAGVCPNCSIMAVRVIGPDGVGMVSDVSNGIIWAADHGAKVISLSLGSPSSTLTQKEAIDYAEKKGAIVIAAAGNDGVSTPFYPAYYKETLAVGASEKDDTKAAFSNFGSWVNVAAPGTSIMSTMPEKQYTYKSGTSMAAPFVAGLAGLIYSHLKQEATPLRVRNIIENTADNAGSWTSKGRINVYAALRSIKKVHSAPASEPASSTKNTTVKSTKKPSPYRGYSVTGYTLLKGHVTKSPQNSVVKKDNILLVLKSTTYGRHRELDYAFTSKVPPENYKSLKIVLKGKYYMSKAPVTAWLWNWKNNKWDKTGKHYLATKSTTVQFEKENPAPYINRQGIIKIKFSRETHLWQTFETGIDYVRIIPLSTDSKTAQIKEIAAPFEKTKTKKIKKAINPFLKMKN